MLREIKGYGIGLLLSGILLSPAFVYGQDLGSTNGLFRSPNPPAKKKTSEPEKKSAPKTETAKKVFKPVRTRTTAKNKVVKAEPKPKTTVAKENTKKSATIKQQNSSIQKNTVITIGKPESENNEALFEQAIDAGNSARDERSYVAAEAAYQRAKKIKPKDARAVYGMGNLYSDQQRWEEAEKAYRQALELDPNSPEANIALSFVLIQPVIGAELSDRYSEAEKTARRAIQLDPTNAVAYDQLGVSLELRGQIGSETQNAYRKAIQLDPNYALAYAHLARLLRRNGLNTQSTAAYQNAVRLSSDVPTMILVADVMQSQQRYAESEQLLRRAVAADPKNPMALFLLGRALTTSGNFAEAEKLLKTSVAVSPNSFVSYAMLGSLYARQGNYAEAERVLMQALRVASPNEYKRLAQEFEMVGDGLMRLGKKRDAARVYRQALSLDKEKSNLNLKLNQAEKS